MLGRRLLTSGGTGLALLWISGATAKATAPLPGPTTLERVVALAMERNDRAQASAAQAQAAEGRLRQARAFFFPQLMVTGAYTRRLHETVRNVGGSPAVISRFHALSAQANLLLPLFDARLFPLYRQARLETAAAQLDAAQERQILGYEAADAFLMVLGENQVVEAAARRLEFSRTSLRDMRARAEAGLVSSNDVTRGELEVVTAERELTTARTSAALAHLQLGRLVDTDLPGPLVTPEALLAEAGRPPPRTPPLVTAGLGQRLDLAAGAHRLEARESAAREPALRAVPSLAAVGQYRVTNERGFSGRAGDGFAGVTASWSVWDGGQRAAERAERQALVSAERALHSGRALTVTFEVRRGVLALQSAQSTQIMAARAAEVARRNLEETAELYRQGLARALEVADATLRLFEAEVALARERYALTLAYLDLRAATGEPPPGQRGMPR